MASACISCLCLTHGLVQPSHSTKRRNTIAGPQNRLHSRQPTTMAVTTNAPIVRRSANYPPSQWSHDHLQLLTNNYLGEKYKIASQSLKERVSTMILKEFNAVENPLCALELVDVLQRLGICYLFKEEISSMLKVIYDCYYETDYKWNRLDLNLKSLGFRLLRQHGYHVPQEIFEEMKDEAGNMKAQVGESIVGMLNLYEASFLAVPDEDILDKAREFTSERLREELEKESNNVEESTLMLISHALELPLLWRIQRFEAIWFIEAYSRRSHMNPMLLELAKLDFNIVQRIHQQDLKCLSRWWDGLGWDKKLTFARDRLVESFTWAVGSSYEPPFGVLRRNITKLISLVNVIDDVYDVYGTLDELEQFTNVVRRWDINGMEELPDYMKICFLGFYNTINEMAYEALANHQSLVIPYVKQGWADYCEANLVEARWFNSGYTPTLEEYLNNSCITISVPVIIWNAYYYFTSSDNGGDSFHNVVHWSSMILRLADDLGTSTAELKRGDIPKSVECYMHETGVSEEEARAYVKKLIIETWKKLNKERKGVTCPASQLLAECATNIGRMGQFTYDRGDIFGSPDDLYKSHELSLLFTPKS